MKLGVTSRFAFLLLALCAGGVVGCKATYSDRVGQYRYAYRSSQFELADRILDDILLEDAKIDGALAADAIRLAEQPEISEHDAWLLLLEKGMTRLALDDVKGAQALFERARIELDRHWESSATDYLESTILDDTYRAYRGYDHEVLLVRVMLALCDLLEGSGRAMEKAADISRTQQALLDHGFGAESGYDYRALYPRIALGSYLEGTILESKGMQTEAKRAYRTARDDGADLNILAEALRRIDRGAGPRRDVGVVHVIALLGGSPALIETRHAPTEAARALAGVAVMIAADAGSPAWQVPIKVPQLYVPDEFVAPLSIETRGMKPVVTESIIDLNGLFREELDAMMPWVLARAMVRRSLKAAAAGVLERVVTRNVGGDFGPTAGFLAGATLNMGATAVEDADTRSWTSLPAQVHVGRLELAPGEHEISFGALGRARVTVSAGSDSYVVVIEPAPEAPAAVLVDRASRSPRP